MKQILLVLVLTLLSITQVTTPMPPDREQALSDTLRNTQIPLEERDRTALEYAKKFSTELPQWLGYLTAMENLTQTSLYLVERGVTYQDQYDAGWIVFSNPLTYAIQHSNIPVARALIAKSPKKIADLMALFLANMQDHTDNQDQEDGQLKILELLLAKGANPAPADNTPLMTALTHGNYKIAALLLAKGAPAQKIVIKKEQTADAGQVNRAICPLLTAIENSWKNPSYSTEMITLLIKKGANVNVVGGVIGLKETNPLEVAIKQGAQEIARLLVQNGADLKKPVSLETRARDFSGIPVMHAAAYGLMTELVHDLIAKKVPVTTKSPAGMTPLHLAYYPKELVEDPTQNLSVEDKITRLKKITELLLKSGVLLDAPDNDGNTALYYALSWPNPAPIVDILLGFKTDPTIKNRMSRSAIDRARELQKAELDFNTKNGLAEKIMEKTGNRDWPSDEQIRAAYEAEWEKIIARMAPIKS